MNSRWSRSGYLDPSIWSKLPEDVLFRILAWLPIKSLLQLHCVSTRWNRVLKSPTFLSFHAQVTCQLPWILMFKSANYRTLKAFDRSTNRWHNISLSFLPAYVTDLVASSAGLLCFKTLYCGQFVICNPVTRSWRRLPRMNCSDSRGIVTLLASKTMNTFQVIVAAAEGDDYKLVTEIFNSATDSWKVIPSMPCFGLRSETACCDGKLYFTSSSEPPLIFSFDLERETWKQSQAPLPDFLTYCLPVVSGGQLHLVGGLGSYGISKRMSIWKLVLDDEKHERFHWEEVYRMPDAKCSKFAMNCYHNYEQISCTSQDDLICLSCSSWPQALLFCVSSCSWIWLPHCHQIPLRTSRGFRWFSLEPNLKQIVL